MRLVVRRLGRIKLMLVITAISVVMAVALNLIFSFLFETGAPVVQSIVRAAVIPLFIAPLVSWYLLGLLIDLDQLEAKMNKLATYDDLTGLYNRRALFKSCHLLHRLAVRTKETYCVVIVDLDFFKKINDQYGHAAGDQVLKSFGQILKRVTRDCDLAGRMGGEEFCIYLSNTQQAQVEKIISRLKTEIEDNYPVFESTTITYTISLGVAENQNAAELGFEEVLNRADIALYEAKNSGRNRSVSFNSELQR
ncbi:GGDEF domain-containing protein [Neptuniibacter sp. SY11_33]|uniref:GGDEF domain-containing protein n=1 Tax=Neptuniibacter sp. SY11_33 TaxID=3398215 RepID=UPI0039F54FB1